LKQPFFNSETIETLLPLAEIKLQNRLTICVWSKEIVFQLIEQPSHFDCWMASFDIFKTHNNQRKRSKMSNKFRNTILATAVIATSLVSVASAFAGQNPTQGRINQRQASNRAEYYQCAKFSIRVFNACNETAGANANAARSCRRHYEGNIVRCQAL
jgi:hypothetical protein